MERTDFKIGDWVEYNDEIREEILTAFYQGAMEVYMS